jgi:hypothetical protein
MTREVEEYEQYEGEVERTDILIRAALSLLFFFVGGLIGNVLALVVVFELIWAAATRRAPSPGVRSFANRTVAYLYQIYRYVTFNSSEPPFPFSDFPEAVEPGAYLGERRSAALRRAVDLEREEEPSSVG